MFFQLLGISYQYARNSLIYNRTLSNLHSVEFLIQSFLSYGIIITHAYAMNCNKKRSLATNEVMFQHASFPSGNIMYSKSMFMVY